MTTPPPSVSSLLTQIRSWQAQIEAAKAQITAQAAAFTAGSIMKRDDGLHAVWVTGYRTAHGTTRPGWLIINPSDPNTTMLLDDFNSATGTGNWTQVA